MTIRSRLAIRGMVQGVGFRPFVYRLAKDLGLVGFVRNDSRGVTIEVEGPPPVVREFERRLSRDLRPPARIDDMTMEQCPVVDDPAFSILPSDLTGMKETTVLADIAPCALCLQDLRDPTNRRYRYPFTNCTQCGPRFTIITGVPYDRPNTTMRGFVQCPQCQAEYDDPCDRRFHAQPNACPRCGPELRLLDAKGQLQSEREDALTRAVECLRSGQILAVLGLGGFQLMVDATSEPAVSRLRERKHRWAKPLAVMAVDLAAAAAYGRLGALETALLSSPEAPIVLVEQQTDSRLSRQLAPGNPRIGLMLPSSPLHHLLLADLGLPVVATSGNLSEEPICITPEEGVERLGGIADYLLVHNRPVERHADDSVLSIVDGEPQIVRRARGYAPLPLLLQERNPTVLAVGGHMKNTVALSVGDRCFVSQHIGDLGTLQTHQAFLRVIDDFLRLYDARPVVVAHDLHGDYASTELAEQLTAPNGPLAGIARVPVQHHHAHLAACLADAGTTEPVLGVIWDGSGLGLDGTIWGGEFLYGNASGFQRIACLLPYLLPGGDNSAKCPRRVALALLLQSFDLEQIRASGSPCLTHTSDAELHLLREQLKKRLLAPITSSMGRLFDAVSGMLGLVEESSFEGQAAMALEFVADPTHRGCYPLLLEERTLSSRQATMVANTGSEPRFFLDPREMLQGILQDLARDVPASVIAARFHGALVDATVEVARRVGVETVALSGGCFQNRLLTERCRRALAHNGHRVLTHHQVPPNDGGLALGQVAVACSRLSQS